MQAFMTMKFSRLIVLVNSNINIYTLIIQNERIPHKIEICITCFVAYNVFCLLPNIFLEF